VEWNLAILRLWCCGRLTVFSRACGGWLACLPVVVDHWHFCERGRIQLELKQSQFLVLRKTPYAEASLVVAGISPEFGQLHFIVRGTRRLGRRSFPLVDLFRVLSVQYRPGKGDLLAWSSAEQVADYAGVARDPEIFEAAGWLAKFALSNVPAQVEHTRFFQAMQVGLGRLQAVVRRPEAAAVATAVRIGVSLVFLDESGQLPDYAHRPEQAGKLEFLLQMALGGAAIPERTLPDWQRLEAWTLTQLRRAESHP
jgi:hypothetical protein